MSTALKKTLSIYAIVLSLTPIAALANSGDFTNGVAIGSSYAGVNTAPSDGLIIEGIVGIGTNSPTSGTALDLGSNTNSMLLPSGTTGQRPSGVAGMIRYNNSIPGIEAYYNSTWNTFSAGGTVNSGTQYQMGYYATSGTAISGDANIFTDSSNDLIIPNGALAVSTTSISATIQAVQIGAQPTILAGTNLGTNLVSNQPEVQAGNTGGSSSLRVGQDSTHNAYMEWIYNATAANASLSISTWGGHNPIELQDSGGNVGLTTATPVNKLDINGDMAIGASYAGSHTAPTNGLIVQGVVGIGTSSPTSGTALDLGSNTNSVLLPSGTTAQRPTGTAGMLRYNSSIPGVEAFYGSAWNTLGSSGTVNSGTQYQLGYYATTGAAISGNSHIFTDSSNDLIVPNGALAIGTTGVVGPLTVAGASGVPTILAGTAIVTTPLSNQPEVQAGNSSGNSSFRIGQDSTHNGYLIWLYNATVGNAYVALSTYGGNNPIDLQDSGGRVGITTSNPKNNLDVNGSMVIGASYAGSQTAPTNGLLIQSNVGIANTSPATLLHVGSSSASSFVLELQNSSGACTHTPSASSETVSCSSDMRFKKDVRDSQSALAWLDDMRIRDFTIKTTGERKTGVVAQEILPKHPEMVHKDAEGFYLVDEPSPWKLVKAIQEQQAEIDELKRMIEKLKLEK